MKKADPSHDITVYEQNPKGNTFGWGVVFSDGTLENLLEAEEKTALAIQDTLAHWDDIKVYFKGQVIKSSGHGFVGIGRHRFLDILYDRAEELGVHIVFNQHIDSLDAFKDADLILAADGVNSRIRTQHAEVFKPNIDRRACKYTWLGTKRLFDAFSFFFEETEFGWFQAHCYRFEDETSTFIIECREETWRTAGLDRMTKEEGIAFCERLFARHLDGESLLHNSPHLIGPDSWISFPRITNEHWYHDKVVLLGDAAATAHFSIGSGTKLAVESAIALAGKLSNERPLTEALAEYEEERRVEVLRLQNAARNSTEWFETVQRRSQLDPEQFAYSLLTRSQRVSHENLRLRDKAYLESYERWLGEKLTSQSQEQAVPPMFLPFRMRELELVNRIVVSPMAMYSAIDGTPTDFHFVHFGARALGGAGLIFTEMTCVSPDARITPGCAGMYDDAHEDAWKRIVDFVHESSKAKIAMQLGHAGRKGSTQKPWEAGADDIPLLADNWPILAPSPLPYRAVNQVPREMSREDMDRVLEDFVQATRRADSAGFDMLELHCAHGYLLSSFISPLTNVRTDAYGGTLENRMRYPLEVFNAMRAVWPEAKPMSVRISATDWVVGGITLEDAVTIARLFQEHGADLIDVSTGQVSPDQKPVYGRMFQTPYAERIRLETNMATMAVGNIYEPDHVNSIIASGRADLCLLARPHLSDPHWTLRAAAKLGYEKQWWTPQYLSGKRQFVRLIERAKNMNQ